MKNQENLSKTKKNQARQQKDQENIENNQINQQIQSCRGHAALGGGRGAGHMLSAALFYLFFLWIFEGFIIMVLPFLWFV